MTTYTWIVPARLRGHRPQFGAAVCPAPVAVATAPIQLDDHGIRVSAAKVAATLPALTPSTVRITTPLLNGKALTVAASDGSPGLRTRRRPPV